MDQVAGSTTPAVGERNAGATSPDQANIPAHDRDARIKALDEWLAERSLGGHWQHRQRPVKLRPQVWPWQDIHAGLMEAGEAVRLGADTLRRTVQLVNPALGTGERRGTSRTLQMSVQLVKPGELAQCHRHTAQAIRFVVQGHGAYTTVEGERFLMEPNDLILTPGWTWHDHTNATDEPVVWLDGLDIHLATWLDAQFQANYSSFSQPITKEDGASGAALSVARPAAPAAHPWPYPPYRYSWADTYPTLLRLAESPSAEDPFDGVLLEYVNPLTGGHTLPTMSCRVQLLRPGHSTRAHRHTGTTIYHVVQGRGQTEVEGTAYAWGSRDCLVVPSWQFHRFRNDSADEAAILFSMTDIPVLEALGLYREEEEDERGE
jgi:gentisate 1,2-dioxygenase